MTNPTAPYRGRSIPAVPTPLDPSGRVHREGLRRLIAGLAGHSMGGVWAGGPIGRGTHLGPDALAEVLDAWREGLGPGRRLIASAGVPPGARRPELLIEAARSMAFEAARHGVDALVALPPGAIRGRPDRDRLALEYHSAVAEAGLPLLVSYRAESTGGVPYGPEVLAQLLARPEVLGVEVATGDGIVAFQQVVALVRDLAPAKLVASGQERFLGYSLMSGADLALAGLGSAYPAEVAALVGAHVGGDAARFLRLAADLDDRARPIFRAPMEGSVGRLLDAMVQLGMLPPDAAHDPWGPRAGRAGPAVGDGGSPSRGRLS